VVHVLPNFLIDNKSFHLKKIDTLFCLQYKTSTENSTKFIRTTMHSMILLLSGEKIVSLNEQKINLNANEIALLTQNNYFMSERIINVYPYKVIVIYFDDDFILEFIKRFEINLKNVEHKEAVKIDAHDTLIQTNINLFQNYLDKEMPSSLLKLKIEELLLTLLYHDKRKMLSFFKAIVSTSKDRLDFILKSNLDLIFTIEDMCAITRVSASGLRKYIKTKYQCTPKVWLDTQRLQKATIMLQNTDKSIKEISTECGYTTLSWFISQFKKYYNCTPKEFRHKS